MKYYFKFQKAFSLIEMSIVMAVMAVLASSVVPIAIRSVEVRAGEKTALEMAMIQEASQNYLIDNHLWPSDIAELQAKGYLNPDWIPHNPWHNSNHNNLYVLSATNSLLTVSTDVPQQWSNLVASHLPGITIISLDNGYSTVSSSISVSDRHNSVPTGTIIPWSAPVDKIQEGYLLCDGQSISRENFSDLYSVIGTTYGSDDTSTFKVPDLRGRTIVGFNHLDEDFGTLGQAGGAKSHSHITDGNTDSVQIRNGGNWRIDDNSGGSDYNVIDPHNHHVRIQSDSQKNLSPYVTVHFVIKT